VLFCYFLPCVWNSQWTPLEITENNTHKTKDNRESHTQERSSLRISHTRQEITENLTHKTKNSVCDSLLSLFLCVLFSVSSCLLCEILSELLSCVCDSLLSLLMCVWFSSHTQERSWLRISHTRQEITENNTHKRIDNRESHTQERSSLRISLILCFLLPSVWNSQWTPLLCVWFSVISSLVCVILCYFLPCAWNSQWSPLLCVWFSVISSWSQRISHKRQAITENLTHKANDHRESHAQEKR
jgi:hypothetical protein